MNNFGNGLRCGLVMLVLVVLSACTTVPSEDVAPEQKISKSEAAPEQAKANSQDQSKPDQGKQEAKSEKPKGPPPIPEDVKQVFAAGLTAMKNQEYGKADALFAELTVEHPQYAGPWVNRGAIAVELKRYEQADEFFKGAINANPTNGDAYVQWGFALRLQGRFVEAESVYQQGLNAAPSPILYKNAGILQDLYLHNKAAALALFETYQTLLPEPDKTVAGWILDLQRQVGDQ